MLQTTKTSSGGLFWRAKLSRQYCRDQALQYVTTTTEIFIFTQ
ncbi:MAG: hypothetical protein QN229_06230 [Desulfurococcaceae archaeon TW002]